MSTFGDLSNNDLRAIANARASRKFFSRSIIMYMVLTGIVSALPNIWYSLSVLPCLWLIIWYAVYAYVTSRVSGKIYRRLLEIRSREDIIGI